MASPAFDHWLNAKISAEVKRQRKAAKVDKVYAKAEQAMNQWAELADGNLDEFHEESDCLCLYLGKMVELKNKRMGLHAKAAHMAQCNEAYGRIKHAPLSNAAHPETSSTSMHVRGTLA